MRKCFMNDCDFPAIPYSAFCAEHSNPKDFSKKELKKQVEFLEKRKLYLKKQLKELEER